MNLFRIFVFKLVLLIGTCGAFVGPTGFRNAALTMKMPFQQSSIGVRIEEKNSFARWRGKAKKFVIEKTREVIRPKRTLRKRQLVLAGAMLLASLLCKPMQAMAMGGGMGRSSSPIAPMER